MVASKLPGTGSPSGADPSRPGQHEGDPPGVVLTLSPRTDSVTRARHWARGVLAAWGADELEWALSQLLTEVVTNAVLHAGTEIRVKLQQDSQPARIHCEVRDASPLRPRRRHHSAEATTGRGLLMLEQLADAWGVQQLSDGKAIWFDVSADAGLDDDVVDMDALLDSFSSSEPSAAPGSGAALLALQPACAPVLARAA